MIENKLLDLLRLNKGICFAFLAAFSFSLMTLFVKFAAMPPQQVIFARSVFNLLTSYLLLKNLNISVWGQPNNRFILFLRGFVGYLALVAYFYSLGALPIGSASLIQYMSPIFSGLIAFLVMKEAISRKQYLCLFFGLIGIGFISGVFPNGQFNASIKPIFWLACLFSSMLSGLAYVFVRKLSLAGEASEVIIFYFPLISLPMSLLFGLNNWINPNLNQWLFLFGIGLSSYLGQWFLTKSLKTEKTAAATNMLYFGALFATLWGIWFFNDPLTWKFMLGTALIVGSQLLFQEK